jgi:hypothetical protein
MKKLILALDVKFYSKNINKIYICHIDFKIHMLMKKNSMEVFYNKSKIKTRLIPLSCLLAFIPLGLANLVYDILQRPPQQVKAFLPAIAIGGVAILFIYYFIYQLFRVWLKKYTYKKPIFIIDENGVTDKVGYHSVGFIPWSNIKKISALNSKSHYLVFFINDKQEVINKFKSISKKKKVAKDFKKNGLNIRIETDWLDANVYVMKKLAQTKLEEYNNTNVQVA